MFRLIFTFRKYGVCLIMADSYMFLSSITGCVVANSSTYHFYSATKHATARLTLHLKDELEFTMTPIKVTVS